MAHKKGAGSTKNGRVKLTAIRCERFGGEEASWKYFTSSKRYEI
jgi:ribosomal protein L27